MKKSHPCGSLVWTVIRTGADIKIRCSGCGNHFEIGTLGKKIFHCTNRHCGKLFCAKCHKAMTGKDVGVSEETHTGYLCPYCYLEASIHRMVQSLLPDYYRRMPDSFYEAISREVQENSGFSYEGGFNDDDIRRAFAHVVAKQFDTKA